MKNEGKQSKVIVYLLCIIFVLVSAVVLLNTNANRKKEIDLEERITQTKQQRKEYQHKMEDYTMANVKHENETHSVDLNQVLPEMDKKLDSIFKSVYEQTKNENDYKNLQRTLPQQAGHSLSKQLLKLSQPTINQSGKKLMAFDKIKNLTISYGQYSKENESIPAIVSVEYLTPESTNQRANTKDNDKTTIDGQDIFFLVVSAKSKKISLKGYQAGLEFNQAGLQNNNNDQTIQEE